MLVMMQAFAACVHRDLAIIGGSEAVLDLVAGVPVLLSGTLSISRAHQYKYSWSNLDRLLIWLTALFSISIHKSTTGDTARKVTRDIEKRRDDCHRRGRENATATRMAIPTHATFASDRVQRSKV